MPVKPRPKPTLYSSISQYSQAMTYPPASRDMRRGGPYFAITRATVQPSSGFGTSSARMGCPNS